MLGHYSHASNMHNAMRAASISPNRARYAKRVKAGSIARRGYQDRKPSRKYGNKTSPAKSKNQNQNPPFRHFPSEVRDMQ
ncbi:predicted protein [Sclerotinia sclerotiorum 1980 UF-70]|uniref:Uncharacterized protein n=1 Tax=Sclerotinia sclerotiorum (strain ATCC 18683 / 1980 / Ss-1) TaxID=665079 RepID=A7EEC6_SCLS1|nr:predicted protein [Sclerotinia sclerotiorum 1980 UF-70]EDO01192.1 predicted protein [Sclerotinia sclerotiorum 1980 UF-70]